MHELHFTASSETEEKPQSVWMRRNTKPLNGNLLPLCATADTSRAPLALRSLRETGATPSGAQVTNVPSKLLTLYGCTVTNRRLQGSSIDQSRSINATLKNKGCVPFLPLPRPLTSHPAALHLDALWPESCRQRKVNIDDEALKQMNRLYLWIETSGMWKRCCSADWVNE